MRNELERQIISRIEKLFDAYHPDSSEQAIATLLAIAQDLGAQAGESLIDRTPGLMTYAPTASKYYADYIWRHELQESRALIARGRDDLFRYIDFAEPFGRHNYYRVSDMFEVVDFQTCQQFVSVGCGPLPMTLFHVHDRTSVPKLIALDIEGVAVETVMKTVRHFGLSRLSAHLCAGEDFDYSAASAIYVANLVRGKSRVLSRIADTAPNDAVIVLRDPYSLGRLLTERGTDRLDPRLEIVRSSPPELSHFARDVFLRPLPRAL